MKNLIHVLNTLTKEMKKRTSRNVRKKCTASPVQGESWFSLVKNVFTSFRHAGRCESVRLLAIFFCVKTGISRQKFSTCFVDLCSGMQKLVNFWIHFAGLEVRFFPSYYACCLRHYATSSVLYLRYWIVETDIFDCINIVLLEL